jgi:hypothetical protein
LEGSFPSEIGLLTDIEVLNFEDPLTKMQGSIPTELGRLTNLLYLNMAGTGLKSTIVTEIGQLTKLEFLSFASAKGLYGTIPTEMGNMENLEYLLLEGTKLTGTVPSELGLIGRLGNLELGLTNLRGDMPDSICDGRPWLALTADCAIMTNSYTGVVQQDMKCPCCTICYDAGT